MAMHSFHTSPVPLSTVLTCLPAKFIYYAHNRRPDIASGKI